MGAHFVPEQLAACRTLVPAILAKGPRNFVELHFECGHQGISVSCVRKVLDELAAVGRIGRIKVVREHAWQNARGSITTIRRESLAYELVSVKSKPKRRSRS